MASNSGEGGSGKGKKTSFVRRFFGSKSKSTSPSGQLPTTPPRQLPTTPPRLLPPVSECTSPIINFPGVPSNFESPPVVRRNYFGGDDMPSPGPHNPSCFFEPPFMSGRSSGIDINIAAVENFDLEQFVDESVQHNIYASQYVNVEDQPEGRGSCNLSMDLSQFGGTTRLSDDSVTLAMVVHGLGDGGSRGGEGPEGEGREGGSREGGGERGGRGRGRGRGGRGASRAEAEGSGKRKKIGGKKWQIEQDVQLIQSWLSTTEDATIGTGQTGTTFWDRVWQHAVCIDPWFRTQEPKQLKNRWSKFHPKCNAFHGYYIQCSGRNVQSGGNYATAVAKAHELYLANAKDKKPFKYEKQWEQLACAHKWLSYRPDPVGASIAFRYGSSSSSAAPVRGDSSSSAAPVGDNTRPLGRDSSKKKKSQLSKQISHEVEKEAADAVKLRKTMKVRARAIQEELRPLVVEHEEAAKRSGMFLDMAMHANGDEKIYNKAMKNSDIADLQMEKLGPLIQSLRDEYYALKAQIKELGPDSP